MKKKFVPFLLIMSIFLSSNFIAPKSQAALGIVFHKKVITVIGGIGTAGGLVMALSGASVAGQGIGGAIAAGIMYSGAILFGGIGLILLDDNKVATDFGFMPISLDQVDEIHHDAVRIYNSEIDELNAIRKTIQAEMTSEDSEEKAHELWSIYSEYLSPETKMVAQGQAAALLER